MSDTLLTYAIRTDPNPLQASGHGELSVVVSNEDASNPITCHSIAITIAVGTTAADLTANTTGIATPPPGTHWSARIDGNIYKATPDAPVKFTNAGIVLTLTAIGVNAQIGATKIYIDEDASDGSHPRALRTVELLVAKFPARFTLSALEAAPDPIESGGSTTLSWKGSDFPDLVTYRLKYVNDGLAHDDAVGAIGPKTITNITSEPSITFTLRASIAGAPPVTRQFTVDVLPRAPEIESLTGSFVGEKLVIRWKARHADHCIVSGINGRQETSGSVGPFVPDRMHYTVTAVHGKIATSRDLYLYTDVVMTKDGFFTNDFRVAPDASIAVIGSTPLFAYDGITLDAPKTIGTGPCFAWGLTFSPDCSRFFLGGHDAASDFANLYRRDLTLLLQKHIGIVDAAVYAPDGRSIYVALVWTQPKIVRIDAETFAVQKEYAVSSPGGTGLCIAADGRTLFVTTGATLVAVDVADGRRRELALGMTNSWPTLSYWAGSDAEYVIAKGPQAIKIIDPATLTVVKTLPNAGACALTATELLFVSDNTHVQVFDLLTLSPKQKLVMPEQWSALVGYGGGAMYTSGGTYSRYKLRRYVAVRAEAAAAIRLEEPEVARLHALELRPSSPE